MSRSIMYTCIGLVGLVALLGLPIAMTASPVAAKPRLRTVTRTFSNTARIDLLESESDPGSGSVYPSPISVREPKGRIRDVNLCLKDLEHPYPDDVQVLLVGRMARPRTSRGM